MAAQSDSPVAVYGALAANFVIAVTKFVAAGMTGSSAMISEGIHSLVDTGNQALILLGIKRAKQPPDARHPFGYGKELYFWSLVVAVLLFGIGGGMSIYEGISHLQHPNELSDPTIAYIVLGISFVVESAAWYVAYRQMRAVAPDVPFLRALRESKNPAVFTVVVEDTAATLGLIIAALGIWLGHTLDNPAIDGMASIAIGLVLALAAVFLVRESKGLLLGESTDPVVVRSIRAIAGQDPAVATAHDPLTMHLGPNQVLLNLDLEFHEDLSSEEMAVAVDRIERAIRGAHPQIRRIFIEAERVSGTRSPGA